MSVIYPNQYISLVIIWISEIAISFVPITIDDWPLDSSATGSPPEFEYMATFMFATVPDLTRIFDAVPDATAWYGNSKK